MKLSQLNRNWECGNHFLSAITQGYRRGGRATAVGEQDPQLHSWAIPDSTLQARIIAALSLLRGPLYQRASTIDTSHSETIQGNFDLNIARELPDGYTSSSVATRAASTRETARLSAPFTEIMNEYSARSNMTLTYSECGDSCSTRVQVSSHMHSLGTI